jgi:DNA-binding transcriptional LysR family regulator
MTFNLQQLHAFATIVASGSLGRAAEVLHVTQAERLLAQAALIAELEA